MAIQKLHHFDYPLAIAVALLLILGILVLASVSAVFSQEKFGKTTYYLLHQMIYGLLFGGILGFAAFKIHLSRFKNLAWYLLLLNLALMALVFIPGLGIVSGGAPRWLNLGFVSFQPSEFLKLSFILYLSAWLAPRTGKNSLQENKTKLALIPFLIVLGVITFLLGCQSDVSTLGMIACVALLMYFSANTSLGHSILIVLMFGGGMLALIGNASYRIKRVLVFLGMKSDPMGIGYQIKQALITVGSGGIFGLGLGASKQIGFLPQTMSDSIFAIYAEETGFIGSLVLIFLFLFLFWRAFKIAKKSSDRFSQILAIGIGSWICIQAFINIGSMIGVLPLTGIPLPFISYGGSHLVAELIGIGILLNISKSNKR